MELAWFESWFNSPYYHIHYQHRDDREAELFIDHLYSQLKITKEHNILDLACGAGRHSIYMVSKGNKVIGIDLASNSIEEAKLKAIEKGYREDLEFQVEDMRDFKLKKKFDYIFNLFTSFGYFETKQENEAVLACVKKHLQPNGVLVIDYLNSKQVRAKGEERYTKELSGIEFSIHKYFEHDFVIKEIKINDHGKRSEFKEKVQLFEPHELENMLEHAGLNIQGHYGDYLLHPYQDDASRSILIAKNIG